MAQGRIEIEFKPKGDKQLISAIKQLDVVTKRLQGTTSKYEKEVEELQRTQIKLNNKIKQYNKFAPLGFKNNRLLSNSFATLRSKLLLVSFAIGLTTAAFKKLLDRTMEQEKAEKKLEASLGKVSSALINQAAALQQVTAFGDETIINAQALIAAYTDDEEAVKKATQATLDFAAAKGVDLNTAADLVGKTLGSSTNALSRYGVEVVGVRNSTERLESLTRNVANLFGGQAQMQARTLSGAISQLKNALGDANEILGESFIPFIERASRAMKKGAENAGEWLRELTMGELDRAITDIEKRGGDATDLRIEKLQREKAELEKGLKFKEQYSDADDRILAVEKGIERAQLNTIGLVRKLQEERRKFGDDYNQLQEDANIKLGWFHRKWNDIRGLSNEELQNKKDSALATLNEVTALKQKVSESKEIEKLIQTELDLLNDIKIIQLQLDQLALGEDGEEGGLFRRFFGDPEKVKEFHQKFTMVAKAVMDVANAYVTQKQAVLDAEKATALAATNSIRSERLRERAVEKINEKFAKKQEELNKKSQKAKRTQTVINTAAGIMEVWAAKEGGLFFKIAMSALVAAAGQQQLKAIDAAKYAQGGYVGGRSHSQGGTMIEAERGEFVVSRRGVDAIGLEALNRINAGAGGGSVNISFSGNVLSKDFLEDEAIPQIKEALRRGGDIGVG